MKKSVTVTATTTDNANVYSISLTPENTKYGEPFVVTVTPKTGYKVTGVSVVNTTNNAATALVLNANSTTEWYCSGVTDNVKVVVKTEAITVTVAWVNGGTAADQTKFVYSADSAYFADDRFTLTKDNLASTRTGFTFAGWDYTVPTIGNEDITVTVKGKWNIASDLFVLYTSVAFDASAKKLVFTTSVRINPAADAQAKNDYANATIAVEGCGFFYGENSFALTNGNECIETLKNYLETVNWNEKLEKQEVTGDGLGGQVYFYNAIKEATTAFEVNKNTYTVNFNFKNASASRSGVACLYVKIGNERVFLLGDAVAYYAN